MLASPVTQRKIVAVGANTQACEVEACRRTSALSQGIDPPLRFFGGAEQGSLLTLDGEKEYIADVPASVLQQARRESSDPPWFQTYRRSD